MEQVRYISLGGSGQVTKNMHLFETEKDIIIVDAGIGFPESDQYGVDVVIPDVSYLKDKTQKIRGIVISHAHEDHIGGLPYLLKDLNFPPIYASKLPRGFIQGKLTEHNMLKGQSIKLIEPEKGPIRLGDFEIHAYRVNHSVPDALGLFIKTPIGNIVHSPDFKFDWTPVDGQLFEINKLATLANEGVLALFSDCLGANRQGYTESEQKIQEAFEREMNNAPTQVFITTMSSNISRMQQAINASLKYGRKVIPVGRSIDNNLQTATNLGFLDVPEGAVIPFDKARRMSGRKVTYLIAGSFGQKGSALDRLSRGEHRQIKLKEGAVVLFSADPIPGIADQVGDVIDRLTDMGARVVYSEIQDDLHVSGHGSQGDLQIMAGVTKPQYFVPIGGTSRHHRSYKNMVERMGFNPKTVFELKENQTITFTKDYAKLGESVEIRDVFVDGSLVGDVGRVILEDRGKLAEEGIVVVILKKERDSSISHDVTITSRGFVFMGNSDSLVKEAKGIVSKKLKDQKAKDWNKIKDSIEKDLNRFFYRKTKREPMILPILVNV